MHWSGSLFERKRRIGWCIRPSQRNRGQLIRRGRSALGQLADAGRDRRLWSERRHQLLDGSLRLASGGGQYGVEILGGDVGREKAQAGEVNAAFTDDIQDA